MESLKANARPPTPRLRVVSNFDDSDRGAGEKYTRAREISGDATQGELQKCGDRSSLIFGPTIAIAKIRDYPQSNPLLQLKPKIANIRSRSISPS